MKYVQTTVLSQARKAEIRRLWNQEYPANIHHTSQADTDAYLEKLIDVHHIFVEDQEGRVVAWFADFIRDNKRFFAMIVDGAVQGMGIGSKLLSIGKKDYSELNGWIVSENNYNTEDGRAYKSPRIFYQKNGFEVFPEIESVTHVLKTQLITWRIN